MIERLSVNEEATSTVPDPELHPIGSCNDQEGSTSACSGDHPELAIICIDKMDAF